MLLVRYFKKSIKFIVSSFRVASLFALITSCSTLMRRDTLDHKDIYIEINNIVKSFNADANKLNVDIGSSFTPIILDVDKKESTVLGTCFYGWFNYITIDLNNWRYLPRIQKKMVLYHELGHCILNRDHYESRLFFFEELPTFDDGCHKTIMTKFISSVYCIKQHEEYYIKELFSEEEWKLF